jgi:translin
MTSVSRRSGRAVPRPRRPLLSEKALSGIERHLSDRERRRAELSERARQLRRAAQTAMAHLHDGKDVAGEIVFIQKETSDLVRWIDRHAAADAPLAHDALQESVEASLLYALHRSEALPTPAELRVEPESYLSGLADVVGEIRRLILHELSAGNVAAAEEKMIMLEDLYRLLLRFETTRAILPLKPKQDAARGILERTRGDVTMARLLHRAHLPAAPTKEEP